ncbi:MAG: HTH merR-type domain-containing protein [Lachnoclostridium sp.]|jgi:DNA-binding transcriptional MerR regulator
MMTIHELSKLSGVSVRTLHYYDKIGLLKPYRIEPNGYRKYNKESLSRLQQILFFKEMDIPLKQIKNIMDSPDYNQMNAIRDQKDLLIAKRNRLNRLIEQMDLILKGENPMDFSVFEHNELKEVFLGRIDKMEEYYRQQLINKFGSIETFLDRTLNNMDKIKESAVKHYGSFNKYIEFLKQEPLPNEEMAKLQEELDHTVEQIVAYKNNKTDNPEVQKLVEKWKNIMRQMLCLEKVNLENKKDNITEMFRKIYHNYINNKAIIKVMDETYGEGSSVFLGKALAYNDTGKLP